MKYGWLGIIGFVLVFAGCGETEIRSLRSDGAGGSGSNILLDFLSTKTVDKIDLLFMIDNSPSMADKQDVLTAAVPDLVSRLVSPTCVDAAGTAVGQTPSDPAAPCPPRTVREFKPITNIHVAVITSSLGGHGAPICEGTEAENDHAELLGSRPRAASTVYPPGTPGFLDWNPAANPGEDANQFVSSFQNMVRAAGAEGCRFPAQLEAVYRFLSDPFPPQSIELQSCRGGAQCAAPAGVDDVILAQRKAFLRPDSLVEVVLLTDRNDCSIRDSEQYFYAATVSDLLPKASNACDTNPNDPCCYSCGLAKPANCAAADPMCGPPPPSLTPTDDAPSLRCFDEKRRFGLDFLYPIKRYVTALTSPRLCTTTVDLAPDGDCPARPDNSPGLVDNPLYRDLTNCGAVPRDPSLVSVVGITGVPWQLIAVDPNDPTSLEYKSPGQMTNDGTWAKIVGDPTNASGPVPPTDPHMQESIDPRPGLPGPNTPPDADPIHGHEWMITNRDDLQYACIFPLPSTLPCVDSTCDCFSRQPGDNNPLCAGASGIYERVQHKAKAYPSLRVLELLQGVGDNAMVASLCARNLVDVGAQDYGYRPAIFRPVALRGVGRLITECLPRKLSVAPDGTVPCTILEATTDPAGSCDPAMNRREPDPRLIEPARQRLAADKACGSGPNTCLPDCNAFHFCEIMPADDSCLTLSSSPGSIGWCYVDPSASLGDPPLVAKCPANEQQALRFVGDNTPAPNAVVLITCGTDSRLGSSANNGTGTVPPL